MEHDIIEKPFKLDILNEIPTQVNEILQHFIHEIKTKGYDVIGVNLFLPKANEILAQKRGLTGAPCTTHKIIKSLPSNKAPGCDKVNAKILKDSSPVIAPIVTSLINNSFTLSTFPLP